jgi:SAM-dependent methyltransferase
MARLAWRSDATRPSRCPLCGDDGAKSELLTISGLPAWAEQDEIALVHCAGCGVRYCDPLKTVEYETADEEGLKYYLENGAGIDVMLEPLSLVDGRPIRNYLEIGCSFGFAMDYARRALGWQIRGYDPGVIAGCGRDLLGLPIHNGYFSGSEGEAPADLVFCSEVIEHVPQPHQFLRLLETAVDGDGILLLTTPNGEVVRPETAPEILVPVVSPLHHVILYDRRSIERLLKEHGFTHVRIEENGFQLRIAASRKPWAGSASLFSRERYRAYLETAAANHPPTDPLGAGLLYRLFKEDVNAARFEQARLSFDRLRAAYQARYGFDIEKTEGFPYPAETLGLSDFGRNWPFNLCGVWYFHGIVKLLGEGKPDIAASAFHAAKRFGVVLRAILNRAGTDDVEMANLCREADLARLTALAQCAPQEAVRAFQDLASAGDRPADPTFPAHLERARRRVFTDLVNLGHCDAAEQVLGADGLPLDDRIGEEQLPTAMACGMYLLNHKSRFDEARAVFARAAECAGSVPERRETFWHARFHEGLASRYAGDRAAAACVAAVLRDPPAALRPVPQGYLARLAELNS